MCIQSSYKTPVSLSLQDGSVSILRKMQRFARAGLFKPFRRFSLSHPMSSYPTSIRPSQDEVRNRQLTPQSLEIAIRSLYHDGVVVVENAIPHDALDHLNVKMVQDARSLQSKKERSPYNYNPGNIQQDPPPVWDYFDKNIFLSRYNTLPMTYNI